MKTQHKKPLKTTKKYVTERDVATIQGLLHMAHTHIKTVSGIQEALVEITGEIEEHGHCGDACYEYDTTAKDLLKKLNLEVRKK